MQPFQRGGFDLQYGFPEGSQIIVHGLDTINFYSAANDILFHWNPRPAAAYRMVVRNSKRAGIWETNERGGGFPLSTTPPEKVTIRRAHNKYEILINGQHNPNFDFNDRYTDPIVKVDVWPLCTNGVPKQDIATGTDVCNDVPQGGYTHTLIYPPGIVPPVSGTK